MDRQDAGASKRTPCPRSSSASCRISAAAAAWASLSTGARCTDPARCSPSRCFDPRSPTHDTKSLKRAVTAAHQSSRDMVQQGHGGMLQWLRDSSRAIAATQRRRLANEHGDARVIRGVKAMRRPVCDTPMPVRSGGSARGGATGSGSGRIAIACLWSKACCLPRSGWRPRCRAGPGSRGRGEGPWHRSDPCPSSERTAAVLPRATPGRVTDRHPTTGTDF